ncbi:MAG: transcription antitermination factor NusB [Rhizobiaceae bacterium]
MNRSNQRSNTRTVPGLASRLAAAKLVEQVFEHSASLDSLTGSKGLPEFLMLDLADQQLARAIATTALRQHALIRSALGELLDRPLPRKAIFLSAILDIAAAQILFMNAPQSAAVNLAVSLASNDHRTKRFSALVNALLRRMCAERDRLLEIEPAPPSAFSPWLAGKIARDHGREKLAAISRAIRETPLIDITARPGAVLAFDDVDCLTLPNGSVRIRDNRPIAELPGFADGNWWVQDFAASLPARLLGDVKNLKVADLCAAPGGKTAQLLSMGADVTAVDSSQRRLVRLRANMERLRFESHVVMADILEWGEAEAFDAVLLDAPCTATGTMRRHPEIAFNVEQTGLDSLVQLQRRMIEAAAGMVRTGGVLVYANCSILKDEGENLLATIRKEPGNLRPDPIRADELPLGLGHLVNGQGALRTLPCDVPIAMPGWGTMDGFFACRFLVDR